VVKLIEKTLVPATVGTGVGRSLIASSAQETTQLQLVIPAFSLVDLDAIGSSYIVKTFSVTITRRLTILRKTDLPASPDFCLVLNQGGTRYKFWENKGELIYGLNLYTENFIFEVGTFFLEIWVNKDSTTATLTTPITLSLSPLYYDEIQRAQAITVDDSLPTVICPNLKPA